MDWHRLSSLRVLSLILAAGIALALGLGALHAQSPGLVYVYDDQGRLVRMVDVAQNQCATYQYDAAGNLLAITRGADCLQPPVIQNVAPDNVNVGETVCLAITGAHLLGAGVTINRPEILISDVRASDSSIQACLTVPLFTVVAGARLTVTTPFGVAERTLKGPLPRVSSVSPARGTSLGGTLVTLQGSHFTPDTTIAFGNSPATQVVFVSESAMTARTPAGVQGQQVDVVASNANGSGRLAGGFTYTISFWAPGAIAVLTGGAAMLTVRLENPATAPITVSLSSADTAVATAPASATIPAGAVSVDIPVAGVSIGTTTVSTTVAGGTLTTAIQVGPPYTCAPLEICDIAVVAKAVGVMVFPPPGGVGPAVSPPVGVRTIVTAPGPDLAVAQTVGVMVFPPPEGVGPAVSLPVGVRIIVTAEGPDLAVAPPVGAMVFPPGEGVGPAVALPVGIRVVPEGLVYTIAPTVGEMVFPPGEGVGPAVAPPVGVVVVPEGLVYIFAPTVGAMVFPPGEGVGPAIAPPVGIRVIRLGAGLSMGVTME